MTKETTKELKVFNPNHMDGDVISAIIYEHTNDTAVKIQKELFQNLLDGDFDYDKSIALLPNSLFLIQLDWIKNTAKSKTAPSPKKRRSIITNALKKCATEHGVEFIDTDKRYSRFISNLIRFVTLISNREHYLAFLKDLQEGVVKPASFRNLIDSSSKVSWFRVTDDGKQASKKLFPQKNGATKKAENKKSDMAETVERIESDKTKTEATTETTKPVETTKLSPVPANLPSIIKDMLAISKKVDTANLNEEKEVKAILDKAISALQNLG